MSIHVVAGVLVDATGLILISQRPVGKQLAGAWEFPGGKLAPGEQPIAALARELYEELGIALLAAEPFMRLTHRYDFGEVLLDTWRVRQWRGEPRGREGQAVRWCTPQELKTADLLPADAPLVAALQG